MADYSTLRTRDTAGDISNINSYFMSSHKYISDTPVCNGFIIYVSVIRPQISNICYRAS
jgi:hypothetical protein